MRSAATFIVALGSRGKLGSISVASLVDAVLSASAFCGVEVCAGFAGFPALKARTPVLPALRAFATSLSIVALGRRAAVNTSTNMGMFTPETTSEPSRSATKRAPAL